MKDKRIKLLRDESIPKAINTMALPAIIGMLVMAIYNVVDTMFVAWLGAEATSATQVVFPIMILPSAIGLCFGIGGGNYVSRLLGKQDYETGEKVIATSMVTGLVIGIILTILAVIFLEDVLSFFGAAEDTMAMSKSYGLYSILAAPLIIGNMVMNNSLRSEGSPKLSMIGMSSGAIINIILDPIFIFVFGWGVAGAAIATTISRGISFAVLLSNFLRHKTLIRLNLKNFALKWSLYREILTVGAPTFFKQVLVSLALALMNQAAISSGGTNLLAAMAIVTKVTMVATYVLFGFGQGFQPVAGYNIGAGNKERVMSSLKYTILVCVGIVTFFGVIMNVFSPQIMGAFKASKEVSQFATSGLRYYSIGLIMMAVSNTITIFYQALGKGKESLLLSVSRQGIFCIPAVYILPKYLGAQGVLMSQMVADVLTVILSLLLIIPFIKLNKIEEEITNHIVVSEECA